MRTLSEKNIFTSNEWENELRSHPHIVLPANARLELNSIERELCKNIKELQDQSVDPTYLITYLFQSAVAPLESKFSITSAQEPEIDFQFESSTFSIIAKTPLAIRMTNVFLTIRAHDFREGSLELHAHETLVFTDIAMELFHDVEKMQLSLLKSELDKKAPRNFEFEIVSNGKIEFPTLGSGYPGGAAIRSNMPLTLRRVRKVEGAAALAESPPEPKSMLSAIQQ